MNTKSVLVSEVFDTVRGKSLYTREYGNTNAGNFPVFSASSEPLTFIKTFDFEGPHLSWATNGYGGSMKMLQGKFSINGDRALLKPKSELIDLDFCRFVLEPKFRREAVGRRVDGKKNEYTKLSPEKCLGISFNIPIDINGEIDLVQQQRLAKK